MHAENKLQVLLFAVYQHRSGGSENPAFGAQSSYKHCQEKEEKISLTHQCATNRLEKELVFSKRTLSV